METTIIHLQDWRLTWIFFSVNAKLSSSQLVKLEYNFKSTSKYMLFWSQYKQIVNFDIICMKMRQNSRSNRKQHLNKWWNTFLHENTEYTFQHWVDMLCKQCYYFCYHLFIHVFLSEGVWVGVSRGDSTDPSLSEGGISSRKRQLLTIHRVTVSVSVGLCSSDVSHVPFQGTVHDPCWLRRPLIWL